MLLIEYGYGTVAVSIITLLALLGIILLPCFNKSIYMDVLSFLSSLAVSTLLSDAMLHIVPEVNENYSTLFFKLNFHF
jgi:hypothetical protein